MADLAWATAIVKENYQVILSENGGSFDLDFIEKWVEVNGEGYFLRDDESPLDCLLFPIEEFQQLYQFEHNDDGNMFRLVARVM